MRVVAILLSVLAVGWLIMQQLKAGQPEAPAGAHYQQSLQSAEAAATQLEQSLEQRHPGLLAPASE